MTQQMPALEWHDDERFTLRGTDFTARTFQGFASTVDHFHLMKDRRMVEGYVTLLAPFREGRIVELGIFRGGSTAFLGHLLPDANVLAVDIAQTRVAPLDELLAARGYQDRVHTRYGVDQSDPALVDLVREVLGGPPDVVIDDASHALDLTRRSFELLFPLLGEGALYVIEDWSWGLFPYSGHRDEPSLSTLAYELLLTLPYREVISSIVADANTLVLTRGPADIDAATFTLASTMNDEARRLATRLAGA